MIKYVVNRLNHKRYTYLNVVLDDTVLEVSSGINIVLHHCSDCCRELIQPMSVELSSLTDAEQERCELVN